MKFEADQYVADVLSGTQVACTHIKRACQRHVDDLATGHERGLYFDTTAAKMAVAFFHTFLRHWKGEWANRPIVLQPWQQFVLWSLFGWKRADGSRRFRTMYLEVARKNGKTTLAAGIGLYLMIADGESGAEIYTAATKRDQARIAHRDAIEMVKRSPQLKKRVGTFKDNLHSTENSSKFEPLGANVDSLDGLNIHGAIVDEIHAHKTRRLWDVLETGTGARRQPLMLGITTAGIDRESICYELHTYTEQIVSGALDDDSFFGLIFSLDKEDDWEDEGCWIKANPNLGISKKLSYMREQAAKAKAMASSQNNFLQKDLNAWVQVATRWLSREAWDKCGRLSFDEELLHGRRCFGGLDLSSTLDVTAWVLVFPPLLPEPARDEEITLDHCFLVLPHFFIPDDNILQRVRRDRVPYDVWVRRGLVTATPGNVIDYDWVVSRIDADMQRFDIAEIAFDRWGATRIQTQLMDMGGDDFLVQFGQGFASMSSPSKELEVLVMSGLLAHNNNAVLRWMADNVVIVRDAAENIKPDKSKSIERIDGVVALIMSLARARLHKPKPRSVYEDRPILTV